MTRRFIVDLCCKNNIPVFEKDFRIEDVHSADEAFVTGTFAGIIPVVEIDMKEISSGKRGEISFFLQKLYREQLNKMYPKKRTK